jgi:hypothetical protein
MWAPVMNDEIRDELVKTTLLLVAETKALKLILGFVLAESPDALSRLQETARDIDDLTLQFPLSDDQRFHLREVLSAPIQY